MVTGIVVGSVVAIIGALINYFAGVRRDEQRYAHERQLQRESHEQERRLQRERWEREDERIYHDERIQAYKEFHRAVTAYTYERDAPSKWYRDPTPERVDELATRLIHAYSDVYTFASAPVENAARDLFDIALGKPGNIADARLTFLERAQKELGVRVEPPNSKGEFEG